jgi:hypothetical protein
MPESTCFRIPSGRPAPQPLASGQNHNSTSNAGIDFDQSRFSACVAAILGGDGNVPERIACLLADGVPLYAGRHVERSSERK